MSKLQTTVHLSFRVTYDRRQKFSIVVDLLLVYKLSYAMKTAVL